ncbi:MAG TPA: hypothetical protein VKP65_15320 [Rhodothermales bacterium]|nr:hypothetical protein [Rhodothermales bacterium]
MGMSKLNIYVSGIDDPCKIDQRTWYVTIFNCDGSVLEHCGRRYVVLPARCGHLEVEVPPGCYYVKAVWSFRIVTPGLVYRANHFTDAGIVTVCCDDHVCLKLFNPSVHRCGFIYVRALQDLARQGVIEGGLAKRVEAVVDQVAEQDEERGQLRFEVLAEEEINHELEKRLKEEQDEDQHGKKGE